VIFTSVIKTLTRAQSKIMIWACQWFTFDLPHCFYKTIDAFSGCLYLQPRYIFPPALRNARKIC
jgi:hypothetical protein